MAFDFKKKWKIWLLVIVLVLILIGVMLNFQKIIPFSIGGQNNTENKPYVEPGVYESFNDTKNSGFYLRIYVSSPEYRDVVINSIPLEVNSNSLSKIGFSAFVKTNMFENLTKNIYVKRIYLESHAPRGLDKKDSLIEEKLYVEPQIYKRLIEGAYILIIANARSAGEMAKIAKSLSISDEMPFYSYSGSNYFSALVSKKGLEMLSKIKGIEAIRIEPKAENYIDDTAEIIEANATWSNLNLTGEGKTICVIDSGVNKTHPYLTGRIIHEHCICEDFFGNGCCPDGNTEQDGEGSAFDPLTGTGKMGHGTHVAGIIASTNSTYKGIAYNSKLAVVRIVNNSSEIPKIDNMINAIKWCMNYSKEYDISVITRSGGTTGLYPIGNCPDWIPEVIQNATNHSVSIVAASGNGKSITSLPWPACANGVIAVGATWKSDYGGTLHNDTNRNSKLKLLAPGTSINSLRWNPIGDCTLGGCTCASDTNLMTCSGTSMATPHVAGAIALLKGLKGDLTYEQIEDVFYLTGKQVYDSNTSLNFSRIDVYKAAMAVSASLLQITDLNEVYSQETVKIFRFTIKNANLTNITNITWQADMEDGHTINSTQNFSLLFGQTSINFLQHDFTNSGNYTVNVSARAGNLLYSKTITVNVAASELSVTDIDDLYTNGLEKTIRVKIRNQGGITLNNINWSFDFGDGSNVSAGKPVNLTSGEYVFVYLNHNYNATGNYVVNAKAFNPDFNNSMNKTISVPSYSGVEVSGLAVVDSIVRKRVFRFTIRDAMASNLSNVNWTLYFGDGTGTNSTNNIILIPNEKTFVLAEHEYAYGDTFTVNATARNNTLIDSKTISIGVA